MSEYAMNRKSKQTSLTGKANGSNKNSYVANNNSTENGQMSKKISAVNDTRRKSMQQQQQQQQKSAVVIDEQAVLQQQPNNDNGNCVTDNCTVNGNANKSAKLNRQSSAETSIDDVNNKLTSHAFQSYDEQEHLEESKEIQSPTTENIPTWESIYWQLNESDDDRGETMDDER